MMYVKSSDGSIRMKDETGETRCILPPEDVPNGTEIVTEEAYRNAVMRLKRATAYAAEIDEFREQVLSYQIEAQGLRLAGEDAKAAEAAAKAQEALGKYLEKKREIRSRYPDADAEHYILTASGTYHVAGCGYAKAGEALTLTEIAGRNPGAKACTRCGADYRF